MDVEWPKDLLLRTNPCVKWAPSLFLYLRIEQDYLDVDGLVPSRNQGLRATSNDLRSNNGLTIEYGGVCDG